MKKQMRNSRVWNAAIVGVVTCLLIARFEAETRSGGTGIAEIVVNISCLSSGLLGK